jgi:hypothetical protein
MAFGNYFYRSVNYFYGGLIVHGVTRHPQAGGPCFGVGQGVRRQREVIKPSSHQLREMPMSNIHAEASAVIEAPSAQIYAILADYHQAHPAILPKPYFAEIHVEEGGRGAGTIFRLRMNVLGREQLFREVVTEPEPGRLLVETDLYTGQASSFRLEPLDGGQRTRVTIATDFKASPGLAGVMERLLNPPITRRIFQQELRNLAEYAARQ